MEQGLRMEWARCHRALIVFDAQLNPQNECWTDISVNQNQRTRERAGVRVELWRAAWILPLSEDELLNLLITLAKKDLVSRNLCSGSTMLYQLAILRWLGIQSSC